MDRGRTLIDDMADQHDEADCVTVRDDNGELQTSSDTPDRIGEPAPTPAPAPRPVQPGEYEEEPF